MSATTATEKPCTRCEVVKPLDEFYANPKGRLGRAARCKPCQTAIDGTSAERTRRWRAGSPGPVALAFNFTPEPDSSWRKEAACLNHPRAEDWFASPEPTSGRRKLNAAEKAAIVVCGTCPVEAECLEAWMLNPTNYGIRAGRVPEQLRALRRQRRIKGAAS